MQLSLINVCDIVIAAWLLIAVIDGAVKGLILKLGQVAAMIAAYVLASILAVGIRDYFGLTFLVCYMVLSIVLRWVVQLFNLVDRIPVIGFVNHFAGAVCGFLVAFLLIYLLVSLVLGWVPQAALDQIGLTRTAVEHSVLLGAFAPD